MSHLSYAWLFAMVTALLSFLPEIKAANDIHRCDHPFRQTTFAPKVFHQIVDSSTLSKYEEVMVIGDVHGCLDELQYLLKKSNASGDNVLKILTGDLTRKGPKSIGVIRYVQSTPSIIAVRGNNDQKVLDRHYKANHFNYRLNINDTFINEMKRSDFEFLENLPYTISLPDLNAIVVHGGLRPGVPLRDNQPYDMMNVRNLIPDEHCAGGFRPYNGQSQGVRWANQWKGPVHVFFGHDHPKNLQLTPYATGLDTSCVYGNRLTGLFIKGYRKGRLVSLKAFHRYFSHSW